MHSDKAHKLIFTTHAIQLLADVSPKDANHQAMGISLQ